VPLVTSCTDSSFVAFECSAEISCELCEWAVVVVCGRVDDVCRGWGCLRLCIDLGCYKGLLVSDCWMLWPPSKSCWSRQQSFVNKENTVQTNRNKVSALADERPAEDERGRDLVQVSGCAQL